MRIMLNPPSRLSALLASLVFACLLCPGLPGCDKKNPDKATAREAPEKVDLFGKTCSRCHQRSEIEGSTSEDIRNAIREVQSMKQLAGRLTDKDLAALETQLSSTDPGGT